MRENALQRKCIQTAKDRGVPAYKIVSPGHKGFPDVLLVFPGDQIVLVEVKIPGGKLSPAQERMIRHLKAHNAPVYVIDTMADFEAILIRHGHAD